MLVEMFLTTIILYLQFPDVIRSKWSVQKAFTIPKYKQWKRAFYKDSEASLETENQSTVYCAVTGSDSYVKNEWKKHNLKVFVFFQPTLNQLSKHSVYQSSTYFFQDVLEPRNFFPALAFFLDPQNSRYKVV
jgi:hypothetical protein